MQIGFIIFIVVGMMIYLIIIRPYKSNLSIILSLVNEVLLLGMSIICVRFTNLTITPDLSSKIGTILIIILISTIAINWIGIVIYGTMIFIRNRIKKRKRTNTKRYAECMKDNLSATRSKIVIDELYGMEPSEIESSNRLKQ